MNGIAFPLALKLEDLPIGLFEVAFATDGEFVEATGLTETDETEEELFTDLLLLEFLLPLTALLPN